MIQRTISVLLLFFAALVSLQCGRLTEKKWQASTQEIERLNEKGQFTEALSLAKRLLNLAESEANPNPKKIVAIELSLGRAYLLTNQYPQAESTFLKAVGLLDNESSADKTDLVTALSGLGVASGRQVKLKQAIDPLQQALQIQNTYGTSGYYDRGALLYYLGTVYQELGRAKYALPRLLEAVQINEAVLGQSHPWGAPALFGLAEVYSDLNMMDTAEVLFRKAVFLTDRPDRAPTEGTTYALTMLGRFCLEHGKAREAQGIFERGIEVVRQVYPNNPRELAISIYDVGNCLRELKELPKAESLLTDALSLLENNIGPNDHNTARAVFYLALLRRDQGRTKEADSLFRRSLQVSEAVWGSNSVTLAEDLEVYARFLVAQNRLSESEKTYKRVIAIIESTTGPNFWKVANYYDSLAGVLEKLGKKPNMLEAKKRAESIRSNQG